MKAASGACQTCKTRRIKCDENKPACQRCTKAKRICIPASTKRQTSFAVHIENQFASGHAKRPRGPRSTFVVPQPEPDLETKALAYYNQYHLQQIPHAVTSGGLSECVAAWKALERSDPMVDLALSSMALAVYANIHDDDKALDESLTRYHRLLRLAQQRIAKVELSMLNEYEIDACLLTIFLMGRYEGALHRPGKQNPREWFQLLQSWSHHEGAMAILKVWSDTSTDKPASEIVKHTRRGQIRSAILRSRILPDWLEDGARFGEHGSELEYDRAMVRTVLLRQSLACAQQKDHVPIGNIKQLLHESQEIEDALDDWFRAMSTTRPRYQLQYDDLGDTPMEHIYGSTVDIYQQLGHAGLWTQYFGARMLIIGTHLRILTLGSPDMLTYCEYRHERFSCHDRLTETANNLASSVPFCLERVLPADSGSLTIRSTLSINKNSDIKPYLTGQLIWPISIASSLIEVDATQQKWFKSELVSIGRITGDGMLQGSGSGEWNITI